MSFPHVVSGNPDYLSAGLSGVAQAKSEALAKAESALVRRRWNLKSIPLSPDFEFRVKANIGQVLGFKFQIDFTYFFTNVGFKLTVLH
jgi:hypothetical protein